MQDMELPEGVDAPPPEPGAGVLELHPNGYGFLRNISNNLSRERSDPFVPGTMIEKFRLREGLLLNGMVQQSRRQQGPRLKEILDVDGMKPEDYPNVKGFDQLTPINPESWLQLETGQQPITTRVMDMLTPIGKGQRALIVAPPRTGKTILLQQISQSIAQNYPEMHLIMLLIDERPEEVTDMRRSVKGDVIASSLDRDVESHVRLAQLVLERCKRLAEMGKDVFLLLDSITRMARAFNKVTRGDRTATGGLDIRALDIPKKLFATARLVRGRGLADDRGHGPDRHRQPHGRGDLSRVQRHGQHGVGARSQVGRSPRMAVDGHYSIGHAARGEVARFGIAARDHHAAPHAVEHAPRGCDGATHNKAGQVQNEPRVHQFDRGGQGGN